MRSTLVTLTVAIISLSATRAEASSRLTTIERLSYACDSMILTRSFYALVDRDDPEAKLTRSQWIVDAARMASRPCRMFHPGPVRVMIDDHGNGYTCLTSLDGQPGDKSCYWALSRDLKSQE